MVGGTCVVVEASARWGRWSSSVRSSRVPPGVRKVRAMRCGGMRWSSARREDGPSGGGRVGSREGTVAEGA